MDLKDFFAGIQGMEDRRAADSHTGAKSIFDQVPGFNLAKFNERLRAGYMIEDKYTGAMLRFGMLLKNNYPQRELLRAILAGMHEGGPQRFIVLKSRKIGVSTMMAILHCEFAIQLPEWTCACVAHVDESSRKIFSISRNALDRLPDAMKPPIRYNSEDRIQFGLRSKADRFDGLAEEHRAILKSETAAGRYPLAGDTVRSLHMSECAKYDSVGDMDAQEAFILSAMGAVAKTGPSIVVAESTANGKQGWFYKTWVQAGKNEADAAGVRWKRIFIPWHKDPACRLPVPVGYQWDRWPGDDLAREKDLRERYNCDDEQVMFRRAVLRTEMNMNVDQWDQEFPESPEVAFTSGGSAFIGNQIIKKISSTVIEPRKYITRVDGSYGGTTSIVFPGAPEAT